MFERNPNFQIKENKNLEYNVKTMKESTKVAYAKNVLETTW
jgi:hypothetical protein